MSRCSTNNLPDVEDLDGLSRIVAAAPNLPVMMLTGMDDEALGLRMVHNGAQDYLVKGTVSGAMLVRAIRQAIERKGLSDRVRDSEERFTLAGAGSGDGFWDWQISERPSISCPRQPGSSSACPSLCTGGGHGGVLLDTSTLTISAGSATRWRPIRGARRWGFRQQARIMDPNDPCRVDVDARLGGVRRQGPAAPHGGIDHRPRQCRCILRRGHRLAEPRAADRPPARNPAAAPQQDAACNRSALLLISLSCYSLVSETLGHAATDTLMAVAARVIEGAARQGDMLARTSTRSIAVVLDGVADADEATDIAGRVCRALLAPITIDGHQIVPTIRMGVVVTTAPYTDPEIVMRDAAAALAEPVGRNLPFCMFDPEIRKRANERCGSRRRYGTRSGATHCVWLISRSSR